MRIQLIADSCCDWPAAQIAACGLRRAPLTVTVQDTDYVDDGQVDVAKMMAHMEASKTAASSACPSPEAYASLMRDADEVMVVTLSEKLSGSYQSACMAREMVLEESPNKKIHVFDSKSAAAGETRIVMLLHELILAGMSFDHIVVRAEAFIRSMRTVFVVEDLSNFIKNGRIKRLPGMMASALSLCPVLSDDGDGDITVVKKARGVQKALSALVDTIAEQTAAHPRHALTLVMVHALCDSRAAALREMILSKCRAIREVITIPAGALSAMYAGRGGIIVAF